MNKYEITNRIEKFAPLETQESWDCSGWIIDVPEQNDVTKIMLCLTVTDKVVKQAKENKCDMIISHHPLFFVPFSYSPSFLKGLTLPTHSTPLPLREGVGVAVKEAINIYCAHTNLDLAQGGTTDCLIDTIFPRPLREREELLCERSELSNSGEGFVGGWMSGDQEGKPLSCHCEEGDSSTWQSINNDSEKAGLFRFAHNDNNNIGASSNAPYNSFLRYIETEVTINEFVNMLKQISPNLRYVNNNNIRTLRKIAFCAGSGSEFIQEAHENGADAFVTGDIKFHTALESPIVLFDIGHFESEIGVLKIFENLINNDVEVIYAQEKSPFNYL